MERDKKKHIAAGFLAGWTGEVAGIALLNEWWAILLAFLFPPIAGLCKEMIDIDTTGFNLKDIAATVTGGLMVVIIGLVIAISGINDMQGLLLR
jgi:hypothetical protein